MVLKEGGEAWRSGVAGAEEGEPEGRTRRWVKTRRDARRECWGKSVRLARTRMASRRLGKIGEEVGRNGYLNGLEFGLKINQRRTVGIFWLNGRAATKQKSICRAG